MLKLPENYMSMEQNKKPVWSRKMLKFLLVLMSLLAIMVLTFGVILAYFTFYPYKTIEIFNQPVPVLNDIPVRAGEVVFYKTQFCKYTNVFATISRHLTGSNGLTITQGSQRSDLPATLVGDDPAYPCSKTNPLTRISGSFIVPENIPAGIYHLKVIAEYQVNPLRKLPYIFETQEFKIEKQPKVPDGRKPYVPEVPETIININTPSIAGTAVILEQKNSDGTTTGYTFEPVMTLPQPKITVPEEEVKLCIPLIGCIIK